MGVVFLLAAVETAEPFVVVEAGLVQTDVLEVHVAVVLPDAGNFGELAHSND